MHELIIEPGRTEKNYWRDLWRYRELFYFLAWRDILIRYKQTVIGVAWALVRPFLTMLIFTFIFGRVAKLPAPGSIPYPLLVFAALLPFFVAFAFGGSFAAGLGLCAMNVRYRDFRHIVPFIVQFGLNVSPVGFS